MQKGRNAYGIVRGLLMGLDDYADRWSKKKLAEDEYELKQIESDRKRAAAREDWIFKEDYKEKKRIEREAAKAEAEKKKEEETLNKDKSIFENILRGGETTLTPVFSYGSLMPNFQKGLKPYSTNEAALKAVDISDQSLQSSALRMVLDREKDKTESAETAEGLKIYTALTSKKMKKGEVDQMLAELKIKSPELYSAFQDRKRDAERPREWTVIDKKTGEVYEQTGYTDYFTGGTVITNKRQNARSLYTEVNGYPALDEKAYNSMMGEIRKVLKNKADLEYGRQSGKYYDEIEKTYRAFRNPNQKEEEGSSLDEIEGKWRNSQKHTAKLLYENMSKGAKSIVNEYTEALKGGYPSIEKYRERVEQAFKGGEINYADFQWLKLNHYLLYGEEYAR